MPATTFDPERYKERGTAGRCIGKLKQSRAVATRYGKRERIFQGSADIASIRIWLGDPFHDLRDTPQGLLALTG
jgi:transposase